MYIVVTYSNNGAVERQSKPMFYEDALALYTRKSANSRKRYAIRKAA